MIMYRHAIAAIVFVLVFHAFGMLGLYSWRPYDIPMHFGGGVAMGVLALALWDDRVKGVMFTKKHPWNEWVFLALYVLGFVAIIGIGWEWFEYSFDRWVLPAIPSWGISQPGIGDTMADFFFDLLGGLAAVVVLRRSK